LCKEIILGTFMGSGINFRLLDDHQLIKAPQAIGEDEENSKENRHSQEFDLKRLGKIDRKIIRWMLENNPLLLLKTLMEHFQDEDLLMSSFGLHEILRYALMKSALCGTCEKVLQSKGLLSKNKQERKKALFNLILHLPAIQKALKKPKDLHLHPVAEKECFAFLSKIFSSAKE
jgi:hypothetical protein